MHTVNEHNYAILSVAFTSINTDSKKTKSLFMPLSQSDILLQTYMQNSSGKSFQCINIQDAFWTPIYYILYIGVVSIWTL